MKFLKAFISWKLWLSILIGLGVLVGLWIFTFNYLDRYTQHGVEVEVPDLTGLSIQEGITLLEEKELRYEIDSVKFTEDFPPFAIMDFYPKKGSKVKPGRRIFIKSNPKTWAPIELPKLVSKSKRLAYTLLEMRGFAIGDTIYIKDPAKDAVLGVMYQGDTIEEGKLLPRGSKIDLILGRGYKLDVPVPNLLGLTFKEAKNSIKNNYFDVGQIYFLDSRDTLANKVIYQDPPVADIYDEGLPISLWFSAASRAENQRVIDSLNVEFRHIMDEDSLYYHAVESSKHININSLPEEVRNQVRNERQQTERTKPARNNKHKIDTTGISIE